jgi:hypothetical protein
VLALLVVAAKMLAVKEGTLESPTALFGIVAATKILAV